MIARPLDLDAPGAPPVEPLSAADSAWLRMERPTSAMCITGLLVLDGPLDAARFREAVGGRLLRHARFRRRVREPLLHLGRGRWEDDPLFSLDDHIRRAALPAPGGDAELRAAVSALMSRPLDPARPLWELHVLDGYEGGSVIVARIHHCVGDGTALIRVLLSIADDGDPAAAPPRPPHPPSEVPALPALDGAAHGLDSLVERALSLALAGAADALTLGKLLLMPADPPSALRRPLTGEKRAAWSPPVPLETVRSVGRSLCGTVNDVLVAATAGALRRWLLRRGEAGAGAAGAACPAELRAIVPVDLRSPSEDPPALGNRFGLVFLPLPVGAADAARRFHEVKRHMDDLKLSREAVVSYAVLEAAGAATPLIEGAILDIFSTKGSLVLTNVPGPRARLSIAGRAIRSLMFWVPQAGDVALGVSIVSYAGEVRVGFAADAAVTAHPEELVDALREELAALEERAGARA